MASQRVYDETFADLISTLCIEQYHRLPKTGKPNINESQWTLLSGICLEDAGQISVVALATGTKSLGVTSYSTRGDVVHDSHAEVLTRRAWLRYLYSQMNLTLTGQTSHIFNPMSHHIVDSYRKVQVDHTREIEPSNLQFSLKPGVKFHFYTSHTPCGDASIFPRQIKAKTLAKIQSQAKRFKMEKDFLKRRKAELSSDGQNGEENSVGASEKMMESAYKKLKVEHVKNDQDVPSCAERVAVNVRHSSEEIQEAKEFRDNLPTLDEDNQSDAENNSTSRAFDSATPVCDSCSEDSGSDSLSGDVGSMVQDFHRTGAKVLPDASRQDPKQVGPGFHLTGVVRTKPGRGDPTYSMSCSDKIARWNVAGWQGTLLSILLPAPVHMSSITVGGGIAFCSSALERALLTRVIHLIPSPPPVLLHARVIFPAGKRSVKREMKRLARPISSAHPVGGSIIWCNATYKPLEISIEGIKQGVSRKRHNQNNTRSTLLVSPYKLLLQFIQLTRRPQYLNLPYWRVKSQACEYRNRVDKCKEALGQWMEVPEEYRQFCVRHMDEKL